MIRIQRRPYGSLASERHKRIFEIRGHHLGYNFGAGIGDANFLDFPLQTCAVRASCLETL